MSLTFTDAQVRIADFPTTAVAILPHRGDPASIGDTIWRFIAWRRTVGLPPSENATVNILHGDPDDVPVNAYWIDLCVATARRIEPNDDGIVAGEIPSGRCVVLRQIGSSDDLRPAVSFIYGEWLPRSGRELRDCPEFVQRVSFSPHVPEHEAITDIFLPIK